MSESRSGNRWRGLAALLALLPAASQADVKSWFKQSQPVLPVVTLRQLTQVDNTLQATDERGELRYLKVSAKVVKLNAFGDQAQDWPVYVPDRWTDTDTVEPLPEEQFYQLLATESSAAKARPFVYLHGYNESFDKSVTRALWLRQKLALEGRLILLSWPSDGNFINYTRDEADLYWSVPTIKRVLDALSRRFGPAGFDIIAHSLGGRGLALAMANLYDEQTDIRPATSQIVFVAADIDAQVFTDLLPKIHGNSTRVTVYTSQFDEPLALSQTLHGYPRLGQSGKHTQGLTGADVIDVTQVPRRRPTGHNYHLGSPTIQADIRAVLAAKTPQQRGLEARNYAGHWLLRQQ